MSDDRGPEVRGAVPWAKLAEIDSGVHHLQDQTKRDREDQAGRNQSLESKIDHVALIAQSTALAVAGMAAALATIKWMVATILPLAIGATWLLGRLVQR
jgi:hypothetical protein